MAGSSWTNQAASLVVIQSGGNFQGLFVYSPTIGANNLIASIAAAAGTDPYTNTYQQGIAAYGTIGDRFAAVLEVSNSNLGLAITDLTSPPTLPPAFGSAQAGASGTSAVMYSGKATAGAVGCFVEVLDSVAGSTTKGLIELFGGKVLLGNSSTAVVDDNNNQVTLGTDSAVIVDGANNKVGLCTGSLANITANGVGIPAGGGPFIPNEGFHTISNATGFTGTMRVKKLPWNGCWIDIRINLTGSTGGTFTFGSLPDSTYYPTAQAIFALAVDQTQSSLSGGTARVTIPTSGAVTVASPNFGSTGVNFGGSFMYPTN